VVSVVVTVSSQVEERPFPASPDHPTIGYARAATTDLVAALNHKLDLNEARLTFDESGGYLRAVLEALSIPVESQLMVFSKTGIQGPLTSPSNPRALFFNDAVVVGYVRWTRMLEVAVQDPRQGVIFYTLDQTPQARPSFARRDNCMQLHDLFGGVRWFAGRREGGRIPADVASPVRRGQKREVRTPLEW
jgi:hypothetical protein